MNRISSSPIQIEFGIQFVIERETNKYLIDKYREETEIDLKSLSIVIEIDVQGYLTFDRDREREIKIEIEKFEIFIFMLDN